MGRALKSGYCGKLRNVDPQDHILHSVAVIPSKGKEL